jgi:hypothetical protein
MDGLSGVPHKEGMTLLEQELYERVKFFSLLDRDKNSFHKSDIHSILFDESGVLTVVFIIPKDEDLKTENHFVHILSDDEQIITEVALPTSIEWVKGVGGEQVIKLQVTNETTDILFKTNDYLTLAELDVKLSDFYPKSTVDENIKKVSDELIEKEKSLKDEIKKVDTKTSKISTLESSFNTLKNKVDTAIKYNRWFVNLEYKGNLSGTSALNFAKGLMPSGAKGQIEVRYKSYDSWGTGNGTARGYRTHYVKGEL